MAKLKSLNRYQQVLLLLTILMLLVFTPIYCVASSRLGFDYMGKILLPETVDGTTVYSGKINGTPVSFTVTPDQSVTFRWGDQIGGPYTVREDPTAVPDRPGLESLSLTGIEIRSKEKILFRGGVIRSDTDWYLYEQDAQYDIFGGDVLIIRTDGQSTMESKEPSVKTILELAHGPKLTSKGDWLGFLYALLISAANFAYILFADEWFRHRMSFQIANVQDIEPSEFEIAGRYIGWTIFTALAFVCYLVGLMGSL